ncbi:Cytochrome p450 [Mycena venus]|uniref:Cytochrome p450 n=1 Tax=Mycena venus TaxID=2733690 RepID=A0A8H6X388_9AGAR|nr:Cytochrome p450 [Mycena venus]
MSVLLIFLLALCVAVLLGKVGSRESGLPPGPPIVPVLGNAHIFPTEFAHYKFTEWARKYGGIFSLKVGPSTVVVLIDVAAVKELLDKRSATTWDRPPIHITECITGGLHMVLARSTSPWKILRKATGAILTAQATEQHLPIQQAEATQLLYDILRSPQAIFLYRHLPLLVLSHPVSALRKAGPAIQYPGGEGNGSYMEEVVAREQELGMDDEMTSYFGSSLLETGSETTSTYLQSLILALVAYPEVQEKAHEEIDHVVGKDRMPTLDDLENMPYIRAMILETHRFRPVIPLGIPHSTLVAEEYQGHIIPKGATIFVNNINAINLLWAFDFKPDIDADGNPIMGIANAPQPFKCLITPRSTEKAKIIEREFLDAADTFSKFEVDLNDEDKEYVSKLRAYAG